MASTPDACPRSPRRRRRPGAASSSRPCSEMKRQRPRRRTTAPIASVPIQPAPRAPAAPGSRGALTSVPASGQRQDEPGGGLHRQPVQLPHLVDVDRQAPAVHARRRGRGRCTTSQAATTMTMIAKIWPSPLPHMRAKAISARLAALSISSRQSRIDQRVAAREHAAGADRRRQRRDDEVPVDVHQPPSARPRSWLAAGSGSGSGCSRDSARRPPRPSCPMSGGQREVHGRDARRPRRRLDAAAAAREHDRADGGDEQQERGDLERRAGTSSAAARRSARASRSRRRASAPSVSIAFRPEPSIAMHQLDEQRQREDDRDRALAARRPARAACAGSAAADVGDDEDVEHHHRAGVDDDLRGGDELRLAAAGTAPPATSRWKTSASTRRTGCAASTTPTAPHDGADAPR